MTDIAQHKHCTRPWYMRPPVWVLGAVVGGLIVFGIVEYWSALPLRLTAASSISSMPAMSQVSSCESVDDRSIRIADNVRKAVIFLEHHHNVVWLETSRIARG